MILASVLFASVVVKVFNQPVQEQLFSNVKALGMGPATSSVTVGSITVGYVYVVNVSVMVVVVVLVILTHPAETVLVVLLYRQNVTSIVQQTVLQH